MNIGQKPIYALFAQRPSISLLFPDFHIQHFVSVSDFVAILCEVFITEADTLKCFVTAVKLS